MSCPGSELASVRVKMAGFTSWLPFFAMLILGVIVNVPPSKAQRDAQDVILGAILPITTDENIWSYPLSKIVLELAAERVHMMRILSEHKLMIHAVDSHCSATTGPLQAIDMYTQNRVHAFFGPVCDVVLAPVARYSSHWNIPVITTGGLDSRFSDKSTYPLLTRLGGSNDDIADFIQDLGERFQAQNFGILHSSDSEELHLNSPQSLTETIYTRLLHIYGEEHVLVKRFDLELLDGDMEYIGDILTQLSSHTRVLIMCLPPDAIRMVMIKVQLMGLTGGDYTFFNVDLIRGSRLQSHPWYRENDTAQNNMRAREAYEALFIITLDKVESIEYGMFLDEVYRRYRRSSDQPLDEGVELNQFVTAFHDAVILYAMALNRTLEAGHEVTNGAEVTNNMWSTTFSGITGTVEINENGDRKLGYSLMAIDPDTGDFRVIVHYSDNILSPYQ